MKLFNEAASVRFYERANTSRHLRLLTQFGASYLIWIMGLFAVFGFGSLSIYWLPSILLPWGVTLLLSTWIKRPRPYQAHKFKPIITPSIATTSFPSEHATVAFALAAIFLIGNLMLVFPLMLVAAILVAISRVAAGVHYFSDISVGALIGFSLSAASQVAMFLLASSTL